MEKIKRNTIIGPRDKGGTGLVNVECKLMSVKVQWFSNYIKSQGKWKQFFNYWITKASDKSNLSWYVLSNSHKPVNTTPFYQDLIYAFKAVNGKINCSFSVCSETKEVPLWHNVCATDDDTELNSPLLVYNNFNKVKDIIDNGSLISFRKVAKKLRYYHGTKLWYWPMVQNRTTVLPMGLVFSPSGYMSCIFLPLSIDVIGSSSAWFYFHSTLVG